jgi:hypothetical protein
MFLTRLSGLAAGLLALQQVTGQQIPQQPWSVPTDHDLNATTMSLNTLSTSEFTVLGHPSFPKHTVRIKKSPKDWCDSSAASYTGYIDTTDARHIFFYFFESRSDPDKDDVILWTNGGPGCSSSLGLFMELGPCNIKDDNGTHRNPHSWNEKANVIFIDQPIGMNALDCSSEPSHSSLQVLGSAMLITESSLVPPKKGLSILQPSCRSSSQPSPSLAVVHSIWLESRTA